MKAESSAEKSQKWKATAEASLQYLSFSSSVTGSHEQGSTEDSGSTASSEYKSMTWSSDGGNPKLVSK
jgi:hypothetical protein